MKALKYLICICALIGMVKSHGDLTVPKPRSQLNGNVGFFQNNGNFGNQYYYRGGEVNICGDIYVDNHKTGPVQATYESGQLVNMATSFKQAHGGHLRLKLCKLNSSSAVATQDCFDQQRIKIKPVSWANIESFNNAQMPQFSPWKSVPQVDDYTLALPIGNPGWELNFTAQLPDGLVCDNCVILWEWFFGNNNNCSFANGTLVKNYYNSKINDFPCPGMNWRSCADIKITANKATPAYKPDPVPAPVAYPLTYECWAWGGMGCAFIGDACKNISMQKNVRPDPLQFKGDGVKCFIPIPHTGFKGDYIDPNCRNCGTFAYDCQTCNQLCMSPDKVCPDYCWCRWFSRKQKAYLQVIPGGKWNTDLTDYLTYN